MTKNITIAIDEELAREVRIEAARAGKSVSRFVAELLQDRIGKTAEKRSRQLDALQSFLSGPDLDLLDGSERPLREQIYDEGVSRHQRAGLQPRSPKPGKAG
jgi:plasmid stability protein